jgi:hypothetical protein
LNPKLGPHLPGFPLTLSQLGAKMSVMDLVLQPGSRVLAPDADPLRLMFRAIVRRACPGPDATRKRVLRAGEAKARYGKRK